MSAKEYVSRFNLDFPLSLGQRVALLFGATLTIEVAAISTRSIEQMKIQAKALVHRNGTHAA